MLIWRVARHFLRIVGLVLLGGLITASLVRFAPGFDTDERQLDPGLSADSIHALQQARAGEHHVLRYYAGYLRGAMHGDLGLSHAFEQPVKTLIRERWPVTLKVAGLDRKSV